MTKTIEEVLVEARALISKPQKWCRGVYRTGGPEGRHCAEGAIDEVTGFWSHDEKDLTNVRHETYAVLRNAMGRPITAFNDASSHAEVLAAFDRALALTKGERG